MFSYFGILKMFILFFLRFQTCSNIQLFYLFFTKNGGRSRSIWTHAKSRNVHQKLTTCSKSIFDFVGFAYVVIPRAFQLFEKSGFIFPKFPRIHNFEFFTNTMSKDDCFGPQEIIPTLTNFQNSKNVILCFDIDICTRLATIHPCFFKDIGHISMILWILWNICSSFSVPVFSEIRKNEIQICKMIFLKLIRYISNIFRSILGIIKAINTGLQWFKNPKMLSFGPSDNKSEIWLDQNEAE